MEVRPLGRSLAETVREAGRGPLWIGYWVASPQAGHRCCYDSVREAESSPRGCCRLEGRRGGVSIGKDGPSARAVALEAGPRAAILLRVDQGRVGRVGAYSADCGLDAGGLPFVWLTGVPGAQSLALLESVVTAESADDALGAIAAHEGPEADALLERQAAPHRPAKVREQAAFWLGVERGRPGYEALRRLLAAAPDGDFREQAVFALSQSTVPEATDTLVETARHDRDPEVRGQALFWLAQAAGRKAAGAITDAIRDDPETEVKKKAVFALSELPEGEGVPHLIRVARENRNPAVREQAFFWLGQSEDPRALQFLTEVLKP